MALTCTPPPLPAKPVYAHPIFDYTVVWGTKSDLAFRQCSRPVPRVAGLYTPTHAQVDSMIVDLTALKPELEKKLSIPLEGYRYQAIGFNAKLIYLNCFAVSRDRGLLDWRSDIVAVCDTGDSYWGIVYDVEHRTFGDFQKNGGRPQ